MPVRLEHGLAGARPLQGLFLPSRALAFCFKGEIAPARVGKVPARACSEALGGRMGLGEAFGEEWALPEREPLPMQELLDCGGIAGCTEASRDGVAGEVTNARSTGTHSWTKTGHNSTGAGN